MIDAELVTRKMVLISKDLQAMAPLGGLTGEGPVTTLSREHLARSLWRPDLREWARVARAAARRMPLRSPDGAAAGRFAGAGTLRREGR